MDYYSISKIGDREINHLIGLGKSNGLVAANALCFEDGKEIFRYGVVMRVSSS